MCYFVIPNPLTSVNKLNLTINCDLICYLLMLVRSRRYYGEGHSHFKKHLIDKKFDMQVSSKCIINICVPIPRRGRLVILNVYISTKWSFCQLLVVCKTTKLTNMD